MHPSASFSATVRVRLDDTPGTFARFAAAVGEAGGSLGSIDLVRVERSSKVRDVVVLERRDEPLLHLETRVLQLDVDVSTTRSRPTT